MPADEIETRFVFVNERILTASVNGMSTSRARPDGWGDPHLLPGANIARPRPR